MKNLLNNNPGKEIIIISGEDDGPGTEVIYRGKRTQKAIKTRITKEKCHGDRWATAIIFSHESKTGPVGTDLFTGECANY